MRCVLFGSGRHGWSEWMRGLGLGITNPVGTGGVLYICLCLGCCGEGSVGGKWVGAWTMVWRCGVMSM